MPTTAPEERTDLPAGVGADYAAGSEHRPLGGYAVLTGAFGAAVTATLIAARKAGRPLPERPSLADVLLTGIATHKVSRLIAKDKVTASLRAPFTRFQEAAGHGEVEEQPRGRGLRLAVGELIVCPYCLAQWVAGGFTAGLIYAPRVTRLLAGMWTTQAIADAAQLAYSAAEQRA